MSYTPKEWACGETITADALNHLEQGVADCCGGGGDCGFECTETKTLLTQETVTTVDVDGMASGQFSYSTPIDADVIAVTFNGVEYECPRIEIDGLSFYGGMGEYGPDFSVYPFAIGEIDGANMLATESEGTYAVKIEAVDRSVTSTGCFKKAVEDIVEPLIPEPPQPNTPLVLHATKTPATATQNDRSTISVAIPVIQLAMQNRGVVVVDSEGSMYSVINLTAGSLTIATQDGTFRQYVANGGVLSYPLGFD